MSATTTVQCAVACKWLQPGSGQVDAFLTGLVDACVHLPRDAHTLGESSCRELPRTPGDVHPFSKATKRKTNQPGKKRSRSMILTDTHVMNAFEAEAAKVKEPQAVRWRERSFRGKKLNLLNDIKTQKKRHVSGIVSDEPFGNSRPGEKWVSCTDCGKWAHDDCTSGDRC